jgi:hypothetical protein
MTVVQQLPDPHHSPHGLHFNAAPTKRESSARRTEGQEAPASRRPPQLHTCIPAFHQICVHAQALPASIGACVVGCWRLRKGVDLPGLLSLNFPILHDRAVEAQKVGTPDDGGEVGSVNSDQMASTAKVSSESLPRFKPLTGRAHLQGS